MNKILLTLSLMALSFNAFVADFDYSNYDKKALELSIAGIELQQSINNAVANKRGAVVTVGADVSCNYKLGTTRIQDAIDDGATEVRIASNFSYSENISIADKSMILRGGYVDCIAAAAGTQSGQTTVTGVVSSGFPVIQITGATQRNTIVIDSLVLTGGDGSDFLPGGGISTLFADAQVNLTNTSINNNTGSFGGAIAIVAGNTDFSITDSPMLSNTASTGGALYCSGSEASFFVSGNSGMLLNTADGVSGASTDGQGGGVYLTLGCSFVSYSGMDGAFILNGIVANTAVGAGGGIYAQSGSSVFLNGHQLCFFGCVGDNVNPASMHNNRSDTDSSSISEGGGAIYATGAGTSVFIYAGLISGNSAGANGSKGGGIAVLDGAEFTTKRLGKECWSQENCNYYVANKSGTSNGFGGAIYNEASTVVVENTVFSNNRADWGTVVYGIAVNSVTTIESSIMYANGDSGADGLNDSYVVRAISEAEIDIYHTTIADNNAAIAVLGISSTAGGNSALTASIVNDASTGPVYPASVGSAFSDCSMLHEDASVPSQFFSTVADPQFVDRANDDYHIDSTISPAVDFCFEYVGRSDKPDMDFEVRGWDDPLATNTNGPYDVGADETYDNDIIFKDDFE